MINARVSVLFLVIVADMVVSWLVVASSAVTLACCSWVISALVALSFDLISAITVSTRCDRTISPSIRASASVHTPAALSLPARLSSPAMLGFTCEKTPSNLVEMASVSVALA